MKFIVSLILAAILGSLAGLLFGKAAGFIITGIVFTYIYIFGSKLVEQNNNDLKKVNHIMEMIDYERFNISGSETLNSTAIFIDSEFVNLALIEFEKIKQNSREEKLLLNDLLSEIIPPQTADVNAYYFQPKVKNHETRLNLDILNKTVKINNSAVSTEIVSVNYVRAEISKYLLVNYKNYKSVILVADHPEYSHFLGPVGIIPNLTVIKYTSGISTMDWSFYDKYKILPDLLEKLFNRTPQKSIDESVLKSSIKKFQEERRESQNKQDIERLAFITNERFKSKNDIKENIIKNGGTINESFPKVSKIIEHLPKGHIICGNMLGFFCHRIFGGNEWRIFGVIETDYGQLACATIPEELNVQFWMATIINETTNNNGEQIKFLDYYGIPTHEGPFST